MLKRTFYKQLLFVLLILCTYDCKHKEKQVVAVERKTTKKQPPVKATPQKKSSENSTPTTATNELEQKLGVSSKQIHNNKLYSFIEDWYGAPYKYGGCQKAGVDCSCFTNLLYEQVYEKKIGRSATDMFAGCDQISVDEANTGDLVFFKIGGKTISHVGVFIKNKLFVHASNSRGVIINSLDEAYYKKYFFCAGKIKKV